MNFAAPWPTRLAGVWFVSNYVFITGSIFLDVSYLGDIIDPWGGDVYVWDHCPGLDRSRDMDGITISQDKWGQSAIGAGFTVVPNHLIALNQFTTEERQISPTEMVVILQLLAAWWSKDRLPFPSKSTIAARAGLSARQVQRAISSLEEKRYVERVTRFSTNKARTSNEFKLDGLVDAVKHAADSQPAAFKRLLPKAELAEVE